MDSSIYEIRFLPIAIQGGLPIIFWACDRDGNFVQGIGPALLEMVPNLLETNCWDLHRDEPEILGLYTKVLRSQEQATYTVSYRSRVWQCVMSPTEDGLVGVGVERTREFSLENQWDTFLSSCPFAIATVAPDGKILTASRAFSDLLGFNVLGTKYQDWTHPEDLEPDTAQHEALVRGDINKYSLVKRYRHDDGHWVHVLLEVGIVRENGTALSYVTDISSQIEEKSTIILQTDVARGILRREFEVWYQPIFSLESLKVVGLEALIRWRKDGTMLSPGKFLEGLEVDTMGLLSLEVLRMVLEDAPQLAPYWIAVNLDSRNLSDRAFIEKVDRLVLKSEIESSAIRFEVTEQNLLDTELGLLALSDWQNKGHVIEVDDFGVASTLAAIASYPATVLKIDMSLTRKLPDDKNTQNLFRLILAFANNLEPKHEVIVEGIEEKDQVDWLRWNGFEFGQGYFYSKPMPLHEVTKFLNGVSE